MNNWTVTWDFQQCGMCDRQSLRSDCAYAQSDQSLCKSLEYSMTVKLQTKHHLEFLSFKGGCRGSSESALVKMPHCWKSHDTAHIPLTLFLLIIFANSLDPDKDWLSDPILGQLPNQTYGEKYFKKISGWQKILLLSSAHVLSLPILQTILTQIRGCSPWVHLVCFHEKNLIWSALEFMQEA